MTAAADQPDLPWSQMPEEPDADFAEFLAYLHLGPSRSIEAAYRIGRTPRKSGRTRVSAPPGTQYKMAARWEWVKRATAHDIANLQEAGRRIVAGYLAAVDAAVAKQLKAILGDKMEPATWAQVLDTFGAIGQIVNQE